MAQLKTIEELRNDFKTEYATKGKLLQSGILKALDQYDLSDDEMTDLYDWFTSEGIHLSEDEDIEAELEIPLTDAAALMDDDLEFLTDDASAELIEDDDTPDTDHYDANYATSSYSRINDPVKMYLKEIGRVSLLNPEDEPTIAQKIKEGDEEAKRILISANLRLEIGRAHV